MFIRKLPEILSKFPEISPVYLFGSQVDDQAGPMSDDDLEILVDPDFDPKIIQQNFSHAMVIALETKQVDVVLLDRVPIKLAFHIIGQGKNLFRRDVYTHDEYEAKVLGLFGDYLPVLGQQWQKILHGDPYGKRVQRYRAAFGRTQRTIDETRSD
jgi:uncharacterized protein